MATGRVPTTANSPLTAKGDLFGYSTTQARVPVGSDGETLVADSSATTGLRWQGNFAAGKNKIINGDFGIWQRGTSFTITSGVSAYTADRFQAYINHSSGTATVSRQTFTAGTAPVAGYEGQYFLRATKPANNAYCIITQPIEDVRTFAGQTVTLSFWAKVSSGTVASTAYIRQRFGTGGSADVNYGPFNYTATTSWQRFSFTTTLTGMSGKTIGTNNTLLVDPIFNLDASGYDIDLWGVQLEAGNVATAFQTATGTLAGELAACQRYYYVVASGLDKFVSWSAYYSSTGVAGSVPFKVSMRTTPTLVATTITDGYKISANSDFFTTLNLSSVSNSESGYIFADTNVSGTTGYASYIQTANSGTSVAFNAEL